MNKGLLWAMLILLISVLVLIFNRGGNVSVNLLVYEFSAMKSLVFLGFISVGVAIGVLIK